jgi:hypothetical protein
MRVEAGQHAVDRTAISRVVDLVDIFGFHPFEHAHELVDFAIGTDVDLCERGAGRGNDGDGADEAERTQKIIGYGSSRIEFRRLLQAY